MSDTPYETLVRNLKERGIKVVAVDFDLTLISVHTQGGWIFTARPLATKVRRGFPQFLSQVIKQGLFVAVVTFSPQVELVKEVLKIILDEDKAEMVCVRGSRSDWKPPPHRRKEGKQSHIESAVKFFSKLSKTKINIDEVLLLDDDENNIKLAKKNGVHAVQVVDDNSLQNLVKNFDDVFSKL